MAWSRAGRAVAALALVLLAGMTAAAAPPAAAAADTRQPTGWRLFSPCAGNCAIAVYRGNYVEDSMADVLWSAPEFPTRWEYVGGDRLLAVAVSRYAGTMLGRIDLEPEVGVGQRIGRQSETELWAALYFRYRGFPWDDTVLTTFALSTGFNYATAISEVERARAGPYPGSQWLHYFSPEITFALPHSPDVELLFRFHHRSGVFGLVSETRGGAHYGSIGLRVRF